MNELLEILNELRPDIDFSKDKDLKVGLAMHLQSLLERQKNNVQVTNVYLHIWCDNKTKAINSRKL